jgi:hypothetical protein
VGLEEFSWRKRGTEPDWFYRKPNANCHLGTEFYVHKTVKPPVDRVKFVSDTVI